VTRTTYWHGLDLEADYVWVVDAGARVDAGSRVFGLPWPLHPCVALVEEMGPTPYRREFLDPMALGLCRFCKEPLPARVTA
jgi:hypothetical protein